MIEPGIEGNFKPETVNEVMLLNRIGELKRKLYEKGYPALCDLSPGSDTVALNDITHTLKLAARWEAGWEGVRGLFVRGEAWGPQKFGLGYYISKDQLMHTTVDGLAHILGYQHQIVIRKLARFIQESR